METKKKKKSGVDYLREKVAKLEEENAQLKREITRLLSQELERTNELEILKIKVENREAQCRFGKRRGTAKKRAY